MSVAKFEKWQNLDGVTRNAVLQVVENSYSTQVSFTGTTETDSGLTATITPTSATSKILVMVYQPVYVSTATANATWAGIWIYRDSTAIHTPRLNTGNLPVEFGGSASAVAGTGSYNIWFPYSNHILDNPSTTNAITYKTRGAGYFTDTSIFFQYAGSQGPLTSRMTLMEIAQ